MKLDELKEHCLKTLKQTEKFPTKTFEEHALVLRLIENQTSIIEELENIKIEMKEEHSKHDCFYINGNNYCDHWGDLQILDKHIAKLKGEYK